jgi:hypothetical protein
MSTDELRRAASLMRHDVDFGQAYGDDKFMLAVAVWLDSHADIHTLRTCDERLVTPCPALAVARAYLGGAP